LGAACVSSPPGVAPSQMCVSVFSLFRFQPFGRLVVDGFGVVCVFIPPPSFTSFLLGNGLIQGTYLRFCLRRWDFLVVPPPGFCIFLPSLFFVTLNGDVFDPLFLRFFIFSLSYADPFFSWPFLFFTPLLRAFFLTPFFRIESFPPLDCLSQIREQTVPILSPPCFEVQGAFWLVLGTTPAAPSVIFPLRNEYLSA